MPPQLNGIAIMVVVVDSELNSTSMAWMYNNVDWTAFHESLNIGGLANGMVNVTVSMRECALNQPGTAGMRRVQLWATTQ